MKEGSFPKAWQEEANELNAQLDAFFTAAESVNTNSGPLLTASVPNETSFHVIILDTDQIGIEVRTKDSVAVADADVTGTSGTVQRTGKDRLRRGVICSP